MSSCLVGIRELTLIAAELIRSNLIGHCLGMDTAISMEEMRNVEQVSNCYCLRSAQFVRKRPGHCFFYYNAKISHPR